MNAVPIIDPRLDALRDQLARRVVLQLDSQAQRLPHDIGERLRVAREQAVRRARESRLVEAAAPHAVAVRTGADGSVALGGTPSWWVRIGSALPLLVLVVGLLLIQHLQENAEISAAAEVDSALLADDLPPDAYGDPGFVEFLKHGQP
ncbi:MAG TPA: DUF3619 family protein [Rubrivivax sp.]|nr:DUF3619 family protein [Rubrivivax sp.]HRY87164.1 DUF3619 family protein [Rubrivivax sp.]HRZ60705.1 DUF3619 family protein [Rubrivivax sp.]